MNDGKMSSLSVGILGVESALRYGCSWPFVLELRQSLKFWVLSGYTKNRNAKVVGFAGLNGEVRFLFWAPVE
jgi:hypothetical protein